MVQKKNRNNKSEEKNALNVEKMNQNHIKMVFKRRNVFYAMVFLQSLNLHFL